MPLIDAAHINFVEAANNNKLEHPVDGAGASKKL
jgi:hypothetical protein